MMAMLLHGTKEDRAVIDPTFTGDSAGVAPAEGGISLYLNHDSVRALYEILRRVDEDDADLLADMIDPDRWGWVDQRPGDGEKKDLD